jgi:hypothetical protein
VEGGSDGVAASSGAVMRFEAEAREVAVGAASEWDEKHGAGEKISNRRRAAAPFSRGGRWDAVEGGGAGESGDAWGGAGERGGDGHNVKWLGRPAGAGGGVAALQRRAAGRARRGREWLTGGIGRLRGPVGSD